MTKQIFIAACGTRGDVEFTIALAKTLKLAGYDVVLAAEAACGDWIASHGVAHHAAGMRFEELRHELADPSQGFSLRAVTKEFNRQFLGTFASLADASANADLLIYTPLQASVTCLSEARGTPCILASPTPAFPTGDFAVPLLPGYSYGRFLNRLSYRAVDLLTWAGWRSPWNEARQKIFGLEPLGRLHDIRKVNGKPVPVLNAFSEAMLPRPRDWPHHVHITGNWFLDSGHWAPSSELAAFLADGPPPIYVGFGSMPVGYMKERAPVLAEALRRSGQRVVLARGWGLWGDELLASLGSRVHVIDGAPHQHLFPLMAGVVHHGGAGTTAAGFRAGRPALITPVAVDQFLHGTLVAKHGAGPKPLPVKEWSVDILSERLRELTAITSYRERVQEVAARMAQENGPARALEIVERIIGPP